VSTEYRFIGKASPRKDARDIATGRAKYINDISVPHMLYGKVLRSPHPHANIRSINTSKAKALSGVKAVLTYQDVPDWKVGNPLHLRVLGSKMRFVGDSVALIAAETEEIACAALELIDVDYEVLPAVYDVEKAIQKGAPQLYDIYPNNIMPQIAPFMGDNILQNIIMGDTETGFREADVVSEGTYEYNNIPNPLPPEPPGAVAEWEDPDTVHLWISSQGPYFDRLTLYYMLGRKVNVKVTACQCGGSYGSKGNSSPIYLQAILLAKAAGRPVKLCLNKEEHLNAFTLRLGSRIRGKVGMKKDGTVTAISGDWFVNTGYFSMITQGQVAVGLGEAQLAVRCKNWDLKSKTICTNRNASGWIRGFGGQELVSALFLLLSQAMQKANIDPFEFFKKNFVKNGDRTIWRDGLWWTSKVIDFTKAMDKGAEGFDWHNKWRGWLKPTSINGTKRTGVGVGIIGNADVGEDISESLIRIDPTHNAMIYTSVCEQGTGQRSSLAKMAAEVLQIPPERIYLAPQDPGISPYEFGSVGSRGTYAMGDGIIKAAEDAKRQLFELAAPLLDATPDSLDTRDGSIFIKGKPEKGIPWRTAMGVTRTIFGYGRHEADYSLCNMLMSFVEVEVDTETGKVDLLRVVNATDIGQIIDPPSLDNQLNACMGSAGIDSAIFEETILDESNGIMLAANLIDYKWRTFDDLPRIKNVIMETPFPSHRFGAVGVGEIVTAPGPSAVLMAISNAIGKQIVEYPATPDRILRALGKI
jgi:CO/xanthine dehydrogenase Mo-binding subunit